MYIQGEWQYAHHLQHYGHPSKTGYVDVIKSLPSGRARACDGTNLPWRSGSALLTRDRLLQAKGSDVQGMLEAIALMEKTVRAPANRQSLAGLRKYIEDRREMLGDAHALAEGWDIGSGPTEATCKTLTLPIKRAGMKWDRDNAAAMMNLMAL
jgi:hypothetical protein